LVWPLFKETIGGRVEVGTAVGGTGVKVAVAVGGSGVGGTGVCVSGIFVCVWVGTELAAGTVAVAQPAKEIINKTIIAEYVKRVI
jgi:hypothetical protein